MTDDERRAVMIEKLKRLDRQVKGAIDYLEGGGQMFPCCNRTLTVGYPFDEPNSFEIGDFSIRNRFTPPH